ncbi:MAG TPA: hypothetical protein PK605_12475 [Ignavibacteria bacterium]|nr:hypothetical protein [Bacteroidota bacterium]HRE11172.1 hypothetical protein [Ignavibacteria bacterium]HRF64786.1 hypothetical protein [Ignavibacteria bacterium]HRJ05207.1 hypothetical protein [Ignavibacteria bacterium]HRJ85468.1 hypothetical protein [Ignavibacteria bacterium]
MKLKSSIYRTISVFLLFIAFNAYSQVNLQQNFSLTNLKLKSKTTERKLPGLAGKTSSVLPISIGVLTAIYLLNPLVEYTDRKVYAGLTKEVSVGFGKLGQHRTAAEYSMVFGGNIRHYLRLSYKYDILLAAGIQPSHMLQGTSVISVGAGYFTDFKGRGIFPEITYGYSIRNHKLLFYPHVKIRYTYMLTKDKPSITDLSFGVILGIANPFIDVNIRRKY